MVKKEWLLGAASIGTAFILLAVTNVFSSTVGHADTGDTERKVCISEDGEVWGIWPLDQDREIEVDGEKGHNRVCIQDGSVYMEEADCPDGYCMRQGHIRSALETIVCLPHGLVVEIISGGGPEEEGADTIAR